MHERYLYPFFAFAGLLGVTGMVGAIYWALSALFLVNEVVVYVFQKERPLDPPGSGRTVGLLQTAGLLAWLGLTWRTFTGRYDRRRRRTRSRPTTSRGSARSKARQHQARSP
jgi:hypothetical protein